ncbi:hypothetical protein ACQKMD_19350 [Viridibacillus sp. NPDC096237]|uniref:hypothetical protein n=1 Tax=Viridibacillus sp. NPDC096237 TaxID=3390721 RepID=UPI003D06BF49
MKLYSGCIAGALPIEELTAHLLEAGFKNIQIAPKDESKEYIKEWAPEHQVEEYIVLAII